MWVNIKTWIFLLSLLAWEVAHGAKGDYTKLLADIFKDYNTNARPVYSAGTTTQVLIVPQIIRIIELEPKTQTLVTEALIYMTWMDEFLSWNSSDYGGIEEIHISIDNIWKPAIVITNSVSEEHSFYGYSTSGVVNVDSGGKVNWGQYAILSTTCDISIYKFPFDVQFCQLGLDPLLVNPNDVNFSFIEELQASGLATGINNDPKDEEWVLGGYICERRPFEDISYYLLCNLTINRVYTFYIFNLIVPCGLLIFIGLLTFFVPPTSGERINLAATSFLAMIVFLVFFMENMPPSSGYIPLMQQFVASGMYLLGLATILSVFAVHLDGMSFSNQRPPRVMKNLCIKVLAPIFCIRKNQRKRLELIKKEKYSFTKGDVSSNSGESSIPRQRAQNSEGEIQGQHAEHGSYKAKKSGRDNEGNKPNANGPKRDSQKPISALEVSDVEIGSMEWIIVKDTLGRVFLVIYSLSTIAVVLYITLTFRFGPDPSY